MVKYYNTFYYGKLLRKNKIYNFVLKQLKKRVCNFIMRNEYNYKPRATI